APLAPPLKTMCRQSVRRAGEPLPLSCLPLPCSFSATADAYRHSLHPRVSCGRSRKLLQVATCKTTGVDHSDRPVEPRRTLRSGLVGADANGRQALPAFGCRAQENLHKAPDSGAAARLLATARNRPVTAKNCAAEDG